MYFNSTFVFFKRVQSVNGSNKQLTTAPKAIMKAFGIARNEYRIAPGIRSGSNQILSPSDDSLSSKKYQHCKHINRQAMFHTTSLVKTYSLDS